MKTPTDAELAAQEELQRQFPKEPPPVAFNMDEEFPDLDSRPTYSTEPPGLRTIALLKSKYRDGQQALTRAREICLARGERVYKFFEDARSWVAQVYAPLPKPETT